MLQSWRGHKADLILVLCTTICLLLTASAQPINHSQIQQLQSSDHDQDSLSKHRADYDSGIASSTETPAIKATASSATPLQPECNTRPVCSAATLLGPYHSAAADVCAVSEPNFAESSAASPAEAAKCIPAHTRDSGLSPDTVAEELLGHRHQQQQQQQQPPSTDDVLEEERHNFALSKDGAKIVGSNKEAKKSSAILDTDSDTFMKNECKADQWFILELSQVAKVDAFQLSQYELYSSRVKEFEVRGRQTHPRAQGGDYSKTLNTTGWQLLGKYTAAKVKGTQTFEVAEPAWQKYLQFHFLSHHGSEPICALNDVLVFGKSAAEDLEDQLSSEDLLTSDAADAKQPDAAQNAAEENGTLQAAGKQTEAVKAAEQLESQGLTIAQTRADLGSSSPQLADADAKAETAANASGAFKDKPELQQSAAPPANQDQATDDAQQQAASQHLPQSAHSAADVAKERRQAIDKEIEGLLQAAPVRLSESKTDAKAESSVDDVLLPHNSAGSAKARHGGTIYDMLIQEIKSLKLQQKQTPRQLAELQRNLSLYIERTNSELGALDQAVKGLQADLDLMQRAKQPLKDDSNTAVATLSDVEVDMNAVLVQLEQMQRALHQVQHRVTAIVLLAIIAWLGVVVLTAPALGQLTWILWIPIFLIAAIGIVWLMPVVFRVIPATT